MRYVLTLARHLDPIAAAAGGAAICVLIIHLLSALQTELLSETLSWIILPTILFFEDRGRFDHRNSPNGGGSSLALWTVALCIALASCYRAEVGDIGLIPALTPLFLLAENYLRPGLKSGKSSSRGWYSPSSLAHTVWATCLVAVFAIFAALDFSLVDLAKSIIPALALLVSFTAFIPRSTTSQGLVFQPRWIHVDMQYAVIPLSLRVVVILTVSLGIETFVYGPPELSLSLHILVLATFKALFWYLLIVITQGGHTSWSIGTVISSFGIISSISPFIQPSEFQAASGVIASLFTLIQLTQIVPQGIKGRGWLRLLLLPSLGAYTANVIYLVISGRYASSNFGAAGEHPVESLIHHAKGDFERLLQRQSQNYTQADTEYRRRYGISPPPGFEDWYRFARDQNSPIIDDFDMIHDAIRPFFQLSGSQFLTMMTAARQTPGSNLWICGFSGTTAKTSCNHATSNFDRHFTLLINTIMAKVPRESFLPSVTFLFNQLDEPRVLLESWWLDAGNKTDFRMRDLREQPVKQEVINPRICGPTFNPSSHSYTEVQTYGIPFVTTISREKDLCKNPAHADINGLFVSPVSFSLFEGLVPVLSTGAPSTMADILFPSPAYIEKDFVYNEKHDIPWSKKKKNMYWAGSNTGGMGTANSKWETFHRQRFVALAQDLGAKKHAYKYLRQQKETGMVETWHTRFLNGRLYDVAFTRIFACKPKRTCRAERDFFRTKTWANRDAALNSRLVFDIDGNGISGRFYKLLASRSLPLKQTLLKEWHDERLIPWVHYIPVSQGMEEVPELVTWLTRTETGQKRAEEMAEQGREWYFKAFREVDFAVYFYRLILELARLQDPKREAGVVT
ncbi:beta-1,2-xylosyltransferase [Podospora australis]|uniref:Beta-1,2-xylosyltransferase n=1 Tax=Podospora australis TaxID=1536484 RepID=A0AAN7ADM6_9PEZI|nr:beta-1,2-xylosyltransferase [Podospora australis]